MITEAGVIIEAYERYNGYLQYCNGAIKQSRWPMLSIGSIWTFYNKNTNDSCSISAKFRIDRIPISLLCHAITCRQDKNSYRDPIHDEYYKDYSYNVLICIEGGDFYAHKPLLDHVANKIKKYFSLSPMILPNGFYFTRDTQISLGDFIEIVNILQEEVNHYNI